jgi:hypothetical protein
MIIFFNEEILKVNFFQFAVALILSYDDGNCHWMRQHIMMNYEQIFVVTQSNFCATCERIVLIRNQFLS